MTKEEFIKKWVVAYESKEQQIEFANEMKADLEGLVTADNLQLKQDLVCDVCAGNPGQFCACNGTGNILTTLHTIRQELFRVNKNNSDLQEFRAKELAEITRLREALDRYKKVSKMIISTPSKSNADKDELRQWQHTSIHMLESIK